MASTLSGVFSFVLVAAVAACGTQGAGSAFDGNDAAAAPPDGGGGASEAAAGGDGSSPILTGGDAGGGPDAAVVTITVYANTDDTLFALDPKTHTTTEIGKFVGNAGTVTDLAVNAEGDIYVSTEAAVYKAALPASPPGNVNVTKVASIVVKTAGQKFYALAYTPAGVLGSGEALVGGDGAGELWFIDGQTGQLKDLGAFGKDPRDAQKVFALSGDIVFYEGAAKAPMGLATVHSCKPNTATCENNDFLVGIDMAALSTAFTSGTPAASLLAGIYGGSGSNPGAGIGYAHVFGLGAWEGEVYGFTRNLAAAPPTLLSIDTTSGKGKSLPGSFPFTNGWSGAGVTTSVVIDVPQPPPVR